MLGQNDGGSVLIFSQTGLVRNGFFVLGVAPVPIYLLDGRRPILFEAGLTCLGRVYEEAAAAVLGRRQPEILFLSHVHYDHCGAAAHLKKAWPRMKAAASAKAAEIIKRPNAVRLIRRLNQEVDSFMVHLDSGSLIDEPFEPFEIDLVLKEGQVIELDEEVKVEVLSTPGHTWDTLSYYLPQKKILVASEAAGCANNSGYVVTDSLVDFEAYLKSLERLAGLDVEIFCQGHLFVYLDEDVPRFFERSLKAAQEFKALVVETWREEGDLALTMSRIKAWEYDPLPRPKQPEPAYLLNLKARIKTVLESETA